MEQGLAAASYIDQLPSSEDVMYQLNQDAAAIYGALGKSSKKDLGYAAATFNPAHDPELEQYNILDQAAIDKKINIGSTGGKSYGRITMPNIPGRL